MMWERVGPVTRVARLVLVFAAGMLLGVGHLSGQGIEFENEKAYGYALFDIFEVAPSMDGRPVRWDLIASFGKEYQRFTLKSDGDLSTSNRAGEAEFQGLYSRLIAPFWEAQFGLRLQMGLEGDQTRTRVHAVVGLQGIAPYWFELEPALFISQDGDVSAALVASYDLFVTQRLIFQPRVESAVALQEVVEWGTGSGVNSVALGGRLRYEIKRELAPYVGVNWVRLMGGSATMARGRGDSASRFGFVFGARLWR